MGFYGSRPVSDKPRHQKLGKPSYSSTLTNQERYSDRSSSKSSNYLDKDVFIDYFENKPVEATNNFGLAVGWGTKPEFKSTSKSSTGQSVVITPPPRSSSSKKSSKLNYEYDKIPNFKKKVLKK